MTLVADRWCVRCCALALLLSTSAFQRQAAAVSEHTTLDPAPAPRARHAHSGHARPSLDPAAPVAARRLWNDLFCMCGECERITLADCACDDAHAQRARIVEQVKQMGLGSPEREEAAYAAVLDEYIERHGAPSEVAHVKLHAWLDPLLMLGAVLAGIGVVVLIVERLRSVYAASGAARGSSRPSEPIRKASPFHRRRRRK